MISPNIILPFDDTNANIPAGWTRVTELDGKYLKGTASGVNPNVTGGSNTHSHTSPAHSHTMLNHTHTVSFSNETYDTWGGNDASSGEGVLSSHAHYPSDNVTIAGNGNLTGVAVTYASVNSEPPHYAVIFIKSDKYSFIPKNTLILSKNTHRENSEFHTASADRYLKGASAGANAGAVGGSLTHAHDVSHSHPASSHNHTGTTGGRNGSQRSGGSGSQVPTASHSHTFSLPNFSTGGNAYSGEVTSSIVEPAYRKLNAFKANQKLLPQKGDIFLWLGSLNEIPVGYSLCDGNNDTPDMRDKFLKINATPATTSTGGNNTHSHPASNSHSHGIISHSHADVRTSGVPSTKITGVGSHHAIYNHTHLATTSPANLAWQDSLISSDVSDNQPAYRTVAYIQFKFAINTASILTRML